MIVFRKKNDMLLKMLLFSSRIKILFLLLVFAPFKVLFRAQHKFTATSTGPVRPYFFSSLSSKIILLKYS